MQGKEEEVRRLFEDWNNCHSAYYRLRPEDFRWHQTRQNWLEYGFQTLAGIPCIFALCTPEGSKNGVSAKTLWISIWGKTDGRATEFVSSAAAFAQTKEKTRLCFGGEEFHFLPGVPEEDKSLIAALQSHSFSMADAADFSGELQNPQMQEYLSSGVALAHEKGWQLSELQEDRFKDFSSYMMKEFPGRWSREFLFWQNLENKNGVFWNELLDEKGNTKGFSRLAKRGSVANWNPGALRLPLFPEGPDSDTDSCLGPIGISASERGKGAGKFLLALSLQKLLMRGAVRVSIDWTNAYNYYKPLGLKMVRNYMSAWRDF